MRNYLESTKKNSRVHFVEVSIAPFFNEMGLNIQEKNVISCTIKVNEGMLDREYV